LKCCKQLSLVAIPCLVTTDPKVSGNIDAVVVVKVRAATAKIKLCQQVLVNIRLNSQQINTTAQLLCLSVNYFMLPVFIQVFNLLIYSYQTYGFIVWLSGVVVRALEL